MGPDERGFQNIYAILWDPEPLEERLSHFSQHSGSENVQSFYDRIKRTALDIHGTEINNPIIQRQLIKVYKNGLSDKRIRNKLYRAKPQTIEQALELAMEENRILRHIDRVSGRRGALHRRPPVGPVGHFLS